MPRLWNGSYARNAPLRHCIIPTSAPFTTSRSTKATRSSRWNTWTDERSGSTYSGAHWTVMRSPSWGFKSPKRFLLLTRKECFIAMKYLDGRTLGEHILGRTLDGDEISKLGIQIAEALSAAHSKGVVHRDEIPGRTNARGAHTRAHIGR